MENSIFTNIPTDQLRMLIAEEVKSALESHQPQSALDEKEEYLNPLQACKLLKITKATLRSWEIKGKIKAKRIGRKVYFKKSDLDSLIS
ncbi:MAG: helix-turn-helix domain-containing protein [Cyclobacteriaceae bacterium]|nr:helix-turn-helix domain-containing protein [Cyclobacteriaceae bacterium]